MRRSAVASAPAGAGRIEEHDGAEWREGEEAGGVNGVAEGAQVEAEQEQSVASLLSRRCAPADGEPADEHGLEERDRCRPSR